MNKKIPYYDKYETGDIILFSSHTRIPLLIQSLTNSIYDHIGIILKNPYGNDPNGVYILEAINSRHGIQIRKLDEIYPIYRAELYWRKLNIKRDKKFYRKMHRVYKTIKKASFMLSIRNFVEYLINFRLNNSNPPSTSKFFCASLIAYIYNELGLLSHETQWILIRPKDYGTEDPSDCRFKLNNKKCSLDKEIIIKKYGNDDRS